MRADKLSYHLRTRHRTPNNTYASLSDFFMQYSKGCTLSCCTCSKLFNETDNFYGHECQRPKNKAAKSGVELYNAPPPPAPPVENHNLSSPTSHQSGNFTLPQLRDVTIIPISKKAGRKSEAQENQKRAPSLKIKLSVPKKSKKKSRAPPEPPPPPPVEPDPVPVEEEMDTTDLVPPLRLNGDSSMFDSDVSRNDGSDWMLSEPLSQPPLPEDLPEPEPEPEPVVSSEIIFFKFQYPKSLRLLFYFVAYITDLCLIKVQ